MFSVKGREIKAPMSDYKKDIVDLIGVNFEEMPLDGLKLVLHKAAHFLPKLLRKSYMMSKEEVDELLQFELGIRDKEKEEADKAAERMDQLITCDSLRVNYWKRRKGKTACKFRCSLGSYMSKRLAPPFLTREEKQQMINGMRSYFPFKFVDDTRMDLMVHAMSKLTIDAGEFLIKTGDFIDKFYYFQSGLFGKVIFKMDKCYVTEYMKPGQFLGSENLFFGHFSTKTIKCLTVSSVWILESITYHSVCHWDLKEVNKFLEQSVFKTPGLFGPDGQRLVNALIEIYVERNEDVLAVTPRSALYVVFKGEVLVKEINSRGDEFTRICYPGDEFGHDRLFTKRFAKLASAKTLSDSILYYLSEDAFHRLFDVAELYRLSDVEEYQDDLFYRTL